MRMPADHLVRDRAHHIREGEGPGLLGHPGVIDGLEQQVAQFVAQIGHVAALDGVGDLVGFLDRIGRDRGEILLDVPGTAPVGVTQPRHDGDQPRQATVGVVKQCIIHDGSLGDGGRPGQGAACAFGGPQAAG